MNKEETSRPLLEQETGQAKSNISISDNTTNCSSGQTVFDLLPCGENNAVSSKELAKMVGAASVRELQSMIASERGNGALILSTCRSGGGYYRPSSGAEGQAEIAAFIRTLRARALNTLAAIKAARKALEGVEGQLTFFDELEGL